MTIEQAIICDECDKKVNLDEGYQLMKGSFEMPDMNSGFIDDFDYDLHFCSNECVREFLLKEAGEK